MLNKILLILALLTGLYGLHEWDKRVAVHKAVVASETRLKTSYEAKLTAANNKAEQETKEMQDSADTMRDRKDETIQNISHERDVAISELRNRPYRPSPGQETHNPEGIQACTAAELYREDAEFLTREAARAESVLAERDYYYQQYEEVREKNNGPTK